MSKVLIIFLCVVGVFCAKRCDEVFDENNAKIMIRCLNLKSMMDIADEIQANWTAIDVVSIGTSPSWSNMAVNVPYLGIIQTLNLSRAGVLTLSDAGFRDYDSLRTLDLSSSEIKAIKASWFSRKTIEVLDMSKNLLTALKRDDMRYFDRLKIFDASANDIKSIEANTFADMRKLEKVLLGDNNIEVPQFEGLMTLEEIDLRGNALMAIKPNSFSRLRRLETLNLAENSINNINQQSFATLDSLKYLNLSNNKLPAVLPAAFVGSSKTQLEELDLSFNFIAVIYPTSLHELTLLKLLDISNNRLVDIFIQNFVKQTVLQTLILRQNRITRIAQKSFEKLLLLKTLDLSNNKIESFVVEFFGSNSFAGNKLRKLDLSYNLLTTLKPNLIALLTNLAILELAGNKIAAIPDETFAQSNQLQRISLAGNLIEKLPENFFSRLASLQEFHIESNRISFLPRVFGPRRLLKLSIGNNPWICPCLHQTIVTSRKSKIHLDDANFMPPFPSCVVIPEDSCADRFSRFSFPQEEPDDAAPCELDKASSGGRTGGSVCIRDMSLIKSFQICDKYFDGVSAVEMETGKKRYEE